MTNILAFIFIGLQIRPILESFQADELNRYVSVGGAVLVTVIAVRIVWHMSFNMALRWLHRERGFNPPRPMMRPTIATGFLISWSGMRGILSLAAAMALPAGFPFRDLIVLTAFSVVLGTMVVQGLTLKPLLRRLTLKDDDPVGRELAAAREKALHAGLETFDRQPTSKVVKVLREEFRLRLTPGPEHGRNAKLQTTQADMRSEAIHAARQAILAMRTSDEIGDDAFHAVEEELDWLEMAAHSEAGETRDEES